MAVSGKAPGGPLVNFHLMAPFSFPARSLQEFASVLRNLEDERIRMVSTAGLLLVPDSVVTCREHRIYQKNWAWVQALLLACFELLGKPYLLIFAGFEDFGKT